MRSAPRNLVGEVLDLKKSNKENGREVQGGDLLKSLGKSIDGAGALTDGESEPESHTGSEEEEVKSKSLQKRSNRRKNK